MAIDCIMGLLHPSIEDRLGGGAVPNAEAVKDHPWFDGIDWDALGKGEFETPYKPDTSRKNVDSSRMSMMDLEEQLIGHKCNVPTIPESKQSLFEGYRAGTDLNEADIQYIELQKRTVWQKMKSKYGSRKNIFS